MSKTFTLSEAQMLIPVLGALTERARDAAMRAGLLDLRLQELSQRIFLSGGLNVDVPTAARQRAEREKAMAEAKSTLDEIEEIGADVADLENGRLEFPCQAEGRTLLLCWTIGETEITHWREADDGSPMRELAEGPFGRERDRLN